MKINKYLPLIDTIVGILTLVGVVFAYLQFRDTNQSLTREQNEKNNHDLNVRNILQNSSKLALYDSNLMVIYGDGYLKNNNKQENYLLMKSQINKLEENLETLKSVNLTDIPNKDLENYQIYRMHLNLIINNEKNTLYKAKHFDIKNNKVVSGGSITEKNQIVSNFDTNRKILKDDLDDISQGKSLTKRTYDSDKINIEANADNIVKKSSQ